MIFSLQNRNSSLTVSFHKMIYFARFLILLFEIIIKPLFLQICEFHMTILFI